MAWIYLVGAGLLEIFWATCLKLSHGFSVWKFTILTIIGMIASFVLLAQATKTLPLGTAYAIWTGIGAVGTVIVGILMFKEPVYRSTGSFHCLDIDRYHWLENNFRGIIMLSGLSFSDERQPQSV